MRTTLVLDDALLKAARIRAAELDTTLSEIVNAALRDALRPASTAHPPFSMITYGPMSPSVHHEPSDFAQIEEEDDRSALLR
ncbi:MAG: type II toxin-antitoxin system VapB family antitoxin [Chloroflexota bacterium]